MIYKQWKEIFTEDYGQNFLISAPIFENMMLDIKAIYQSTFRKGMCFGILPGLVIGFITPHFVLPVAAVLETIAVVVMLSAIGLILAVLIDETT